MPVGRSEPVLLHKGDLRLGLDYAFSRRDDVRRGTKIIVDQLGQSTRAHIVTGRATLGFGRRVALDLSLPVIRFRSERSGVVGTSTNLGDLSLSVRSYTTPRILGQPANIYYAIGATLPVGSGVNNPITNERNFASGTVDPFVSLLAILSVASDWSIGTSFLTRQIVSSTSGDDRTGDYYSVSVGPDYRVFVAGLIAGARIRYVARGQDRYDGVSFPNSGGEWTYADVSLTKDVIGQGEGALQLWANLEVPVHQFVRGTQLTDSWGVRVGATIGMTVFGGHGSQPGSVFDQSE